MINLLRDEVSDDLQVFAFALFQDLASSSFSNSLMFITTCDVWFQVKNAARKI